LGGKHWRASGVSDTKEGVSITFLSAPAAITLPLGC
jgi:hypothetical protein